MAKMNQYEWIEPIIIIIIIVYSLSTIHQRALWHLLRCSLPEPIFDNFPQFASSSNLKSEKKKDLFISNFRNSWTFTWIKICVLILTVTTTKKFFVYRPNSKIIYRKFAAMREWNAMQFSNGMPYNNPNDFH